jgi:hypothetical protein
VRRRRPASDGRRTVELPRVGAIVEVELPGRDLTWRSRVEQIDGATLRVAAPVGDSGGPVILPDGALIRLCWPTTLGITVLDGTADGTEHHDVGSCWLVQARTSARTQRRAAFRLPIALDVTLARGGLAALAATVDTLDISELGIACLVPQAEVLEAGDELWVSFTLPTGEVVHGRTEVRRLARRLRRDEAHLRRVVLVFSDEDPVRRERLRRFVVDRQMQRRRPGDLADA